MEAIRNAEAGNLINILKSNSNANPQRILIATPFLSQINGLRLPVFLALTRSLSEDWISLHYFVCNGQPPQNPPKSSAEVLDRERLKDYIVRVLNNTDSPPSMTCGELKTERRIEEGGVSRAVGCRVPLLQEGLVVEGLGDRSLVGGKDSSGAGPSFFN